jgi:hypothetical protein
MLAAGGIAELVGPSREEELRTAILEALAPHRTPSGGYRLEDEWQYRIASA